MNENSFEAWLDLGRKPTDLRRVSGDYESFLEEIVLMLVAFC